MNLISENIKNLTSLWKITGELADTYTSGQYFDFVDINYSDWPNRLWLNIDINEDNIESIKKHLLAHPTKLIIPYWDIYQSSSYELLASNGFKKLSEQVGMSLNLTQSYQQTYKMPIKRVADKENALLWEKLFEQSFGYRISHKILLLSYNVINYSIAYYENEPVGIVLLHHNGDAVIGIHSMGVIPKMRKKGFAKQMMIALLNQSIGQGFKHAVLQASSMGKGLYLKLGFEEQFIMKNYALTE
jgi:ribosomal protein S18 acetylase RimI-like enzyme